MADPGRTPHHAYLHGFASGPSSFKGTELAKRFADRGLNLHLPDLNIPCFAQLTCSGALASFDRFTDEHGPTSARWSLIGSSLGGYLAARWAELHPERVEHLVLLCPGFDLPSRWARLFSVETLQRWKEKGSIPVVDAAGRLVKLHHDFFLDACEHPPYPEVPCPTLILHGSRDEMVPIESSREYAATRDRVELVELDDDHGLTDSIERIADRALRFFDLSGQPPPRRDL